MCSNPQIMPDGNQVSCRVCNECITTRKNDWVARCMAEKATSHQALAFTLTYRNDQSGISPDQSKVFHYKDIQNFLKKLRREYAQQYDGATGELRYIVAGEHGSKNGRVHWHMALFADRNITTLGDWIRPIYYNPNREKTLDLWEWSIWPHGHVDLKIPDQGGFAYVIKYALKDMFNSVKSKGTKREAKAEDHGASYFRMSKVPPIGFRYLQRKCDHLQQKKSVMTSLEVKIPGYSGYWWPKKLQREYLIDRLRQINDEVNKTQGRDAPQWTTLLSSLSEVKQTNDWERLVYGTEQKTEKYDLFEEQERIRSDHAAIRKQCGGSVPCKQCSWDEHGKLYPEVREIYTSLRKEHAEQNTRQTFERYVKSKERCHPLCQLIHTAERLAAFARPSGGPNAS